LYKPFGQQDVTLWSIASDGYVRNSNINVLFEQMKKLKLFLLGALFSPTTFAQITGNRYLYSYDSAGNIISRFITFLRDEQNDNSDNDTFNNNSGEEDNRVTVRTDPSWSNVQIEIDGEITQGDMLSIFTSDGFFVKSFRIESNMFSLNLSMLREGTYLFRFRLNKKIIRRKYLKEN
jgi:hypothetical protein